MELTRDQARAYFNECGLSYQNITKDHFKKLRTVVNQNLKESGYLDGSFSCHGRIKYTSSDKGGVFEASFNCQAFYFTGRQCIAFEKGGFIGFAGWSDTQNIQPILHGFFTWCDWVKEQLDITYKQEQN